MNWFAKRRETNPDDYRMSLGDHLEELRSCVLRSLCAVVATCLICIWPAKYLLEIIARPVVLALRRYGQPDTFLATSPVETFMVYVKVVLIFGLILAGPYVLYQLWSFVAAGLYRHEKKWVRRLVPASVGLFLTGVLFMYFFALLLTLKFLVSFSGWLPQPPAKPNFIEKNLLGIHAAAPPASQPAVGQTPPVPLLEDDPPEPPVGALWFNQTDGKLKLRAPDGTFSLQLQRDDARAMVTTHFKIGEYLSFVLTLTIAFGAAFQMPLVVMFLVRSGIVPAVTFRKYRKFVILIIIFIAGVLAPPDLLSHLMLSMPMWLLFEAGLFLGARKGKAESAAEPQPVESQQA